MFITVILKLQQAQSSRIISDSVQDILLHWEDGGTEGLHLHMFLENVKSQFT